MYFSLFIAVITLLAAWEWLSLIDVDNPVKRILFLIGLIVPMLGVTYWTVFLEVDERDLGMAGIKRLFRRFGMAGDCACAVLVACHDFTPKSFRAIVENGIFSQRFKSFVGWLVLLSAWMFLVKLRAYYGAGMVLYFLLLIWVADISAYFVGKKWGKDKLAPEISPGKTVQGMYGALASAFLCGMGLQIVLWS